MTEKCPHIKSKRAMEGESWDYCEITERPSGRIKPCLLMSNNTCEIWEEIKTEWDSDIKFYGGKR